jgi:predicted ATPase
MRDLPSGTVTFLFTDIEGSTGLLHELGAEAFSAALEDHRRLVRDTFAGHGGVEVDTQGDAFFVAFPSAPGAISAAAEAQEGLAGGPIRVRMGLHTGTPHLSGEGYVGQDVHLGARIAAAGHGGQVLLSKQTRQQIAGDAPEFVDLGEHRLKDFAAPVWIYQLGSQRFPPLKTISNTNLPRPASSFVGRDKEVAEIGALLNDGARMVTLTGAGGSGKTRLAIEAAAELVPEFRNGVFWVDLAPLRDPALVLEVIGQTLGAKDGLAVHIGERRMLLVLDNLEQVIESAPELAALLAACPNLRLLDTSRELLRVRGEVEYAVPPLATPEAVELFAVRSGLPPNETIDELCRRLDNLPLAVELAAARTSVLSPAQILERISKRLDLLKGGRDTEARQQTLRATIAWSYDLLNREEQGLFARLSVFRGGCTLEWSEEVCDADLDVLQSLVDKSLVRHADERFTMLETIREYAAERLDESGEADELRRRHAERFLALAEEAAPSLHESSEWVDRLERDHDNIRAALDVLQARGDVALALRFTAALAYFWYLGGHLREGRDRLESVVSADERQTAIRAKALNSAAWMLVEGGDAAAGARRAEQALAIYRALGDSRGIADALLELGVATAEKGDPGLALPILEESVERFDELGNEQDLLLAVRNLAGVYQEAGDLRRARALHERNLMRAREIQDARTQAMSLGQLAMIAIDEGRVAAAMPMLKAQIHLWHDLNQQLPLAVSLCRFALALAAAGDARKAVRLLSASHALLDDQMPRTAEVAKINDQTLHATHAQLDEAAFAEAWELGRRLTADEAIALAMGITT